MDPVLVIATLVDWGSLACCTALIFASRGWVAGATALWLGAIASATLLYTSPEPRPSGADPVAIALLGWPLFLLIARLELVILSFIFPSRFYARSPAQRP